MSASKKGGLRGRRAEALKRLEKQFAAFKAAGTDKEAWITTRNGKKHTHKSVSFATECKRFETEIETLKHRIN